MQNCRYYVISRLQSASRSRCQGWQSMSIHPSHHLPCRCTKLVSSAGAHLVTELIDVKGEMLISILSHNLPNRHYAMVKMCLHVAHVRLCKRKEKDFAHSWLHNIVCVYLVLRRRHFLPARPRFLKIAHYEYYSITCVNQNVHTFFYSASC
jgi:hypothetical protein